MSESKNCVNLHEFIPEYLPDSPFLISIGTHNRKLLQSIVYDLHSKRRIHTAILFVESEAGRQDWKSIIPPLYTHSHISDKLIGNIIRRIELQKEYNIPHCCVIFDGADSKLVNPISTFKNKCDVIMSGYTIPDADLIFEPTSQYGLSTVDKQLSTWCHARGYIYGKSKDRMYYYTLKNHSPHYVGDKQYVLYALERHKLTTYF